MERKSFPVEVKAAGDSGQFTALASVFGNVDRGGDRVMPGAFAKVLDRLREQGDPLPIVLSHQHDNPMAIVGKADPADVIETTEGLQVTGNLDLQNPTAKQVHKLMKDRLLKGWSFAYTVEKGGQKVKNGVNEVTNIKDLFEAGPTLIGMNPEAQLQAVKSIAASKQTPGEEAADLIDGIMSLAEDFIATEPDPADVTTMKQIMGLLQTLDASEAAEGEASFRAAGTKSTTKKSLTAEQLVSSMVKDTEDYLRRFGADDVLGRIVEAAFKQFRMGKRVIAQGAAHDEPAQKAEWSAAFVGNLPDSSFLYIEPGGSKDGDGNTTPRSLRHFHYKDDSGNVDLPHLRNALARIPQANLPQSIKDRLTSEAQRILDITKSAESVIPEVEDRENEEPLPAKFARQDPLAELTDDLWLATAAGNPGGSNADAERASP